VSRQTDSQSKTKNRHTPPTLSAPERESALVFVTPDGTLTAEGDAHGVDAEHARALYREMFLARTVDREALSLQRQGELNLWLMCLGQEAAQIGSVSALRPSDMIFPSYREHAVALYRGVTPGELLTQWRGVSHSGWDPAKYNLQMASLVLGTHTLHATGYAAGARMEHTDEVVATYFGDGSTSQGDVNEAFNWASAGRLPVLFICQNNQWAISTPASVQSGGQIFRRAAGFGMPTWFVDGNDVLAVHAATTAAAAYIRINGGPALIEAETYRMAGHSSSDDPTRYRSDEELAAWALRDPLTRIEKLLRRLNTPESFFAELDQAAERLATEVRESCRSLQPSALGDLFGNVYAEPHGTLETERLAYLESVRVLAEVTR
jgi:2-oxoisovalerate dehydrogenase E1 component alpha subunit